MSLILDALRKSEAERRRGQVPDLHTEPAPGVEPEPDGPSLWLWMTLALAAAVVLALTLWLFRTMTAEPPATIGEPDARAHVGAPDEATANPLLAETNAPVAQPGAAATPPSEPAATVREPVSAPSPAEAEDIASGDMPPPEAEPSPIAPRADVTATERLAPAPQTPRVPAQDVSADIAAAPAEAPAPTTPPAEAAATSTVPAVTTTPRRPSLLSDLSVAERERLPPLRMSMHLWAPTQRFAIIDGARVSEGDRIGDAVVEEITPDGVLLAWQGYRLHIPVR